MEKHIISLESAMKLGELVTNATQLLRKTLKYSSLEDIPEELTRILTQPGLGQQGAISLNKFIKLKEIYTQLSLFEDDLCQIIDDLAYEEYYKGRAV